MGLHRNARLGLAGRRLLVAEVAAGYSCREAARRRGVSATTACKWWRRWLAASEGDRGSLACLEDRSSRPHHSPRLLGAAEQELICACRRRTGWGPRLIAGETGHPHATVWRALRRAGISRPAPQPREQPRRYEWPCPGDLLHIDTKRFARFSRPGHAVTRDRHTTAKEMRLRVGYEWVHSLVDDHSRLAYSELHRNERADTVTGFVTRGLAFFARFGITPKRLMSDNAWTYTRNRSLAPLLTEHGIRHLLIRHADPRSTARSSATSRPSNANGRWARSTSQATTAPTR
jgi:transposase